MIIRCAYLEGSVAPGAQQQFDALMSQTVLPAIASYPGLRGVKLRKLALADEGAPPVYMVVELHFDSIADMNAALASPVRQAVRERIGSAMSLFKGRVYHLVFDETASG